MMRDIATPEGVFSWCGVKAMRSMFLLLLLCASISVAAQSSNPSQPGSADQHPSKKAKVKDQVTVRGCVGKSSTDYILTQADKGNSYELQGSGKLRLSRYLGQQVEVTGIESPSMSTSSDFLTRSGPPSADTITVTSIKTLQKRCSAE